MKEVFAGAYLTLSVMFVLVLYIPVAIVHCAYAAVVVSWEHAEELRS